MRQFLFKLIAPRPTFAQDMMEAERKVMQEHVVYWKGLADRGVAVVFGPVLDPKGSGRSQSLKCQMKQKHERLCPTIRSSKPTWARSRSIQCPLGR